MPDFPYLTLEYLATAVVLLDDESRIAYINPAAEHLFDVSDKNLHGLPLQQVFTHTEQLASAMQQAIYNNASYIEHDLTLGTHAHGKLHLRCAATPLQFTRRYLLLEFHPMDRPLKLAREEQMLDQTQANRLLLRNQKPARRYTRCGAIARTGIGKTSLARIHPSHRARGRPFALAHGEIACPAKCLAL